MAQDLGPTVHSRKVLVTGATGFVGRQLLPALSARGYAVRAACRSIPQNGSAEIEWIQVKDIGPDTDWTAALGGVDHVVHLAGLAHRLDDEAEALAGAFLRVNAAGSRRLAEAMRAMGIPGRLIFMSSVKAVVSESDEVVSATTPCHPDHEYGISKLEAERAIEEALSGTNSDWCILRPCLVYGPGNLGNMARLVRLVNTGIPLPLGSVRNHRSFIYLGNLIDLILVCLEHPAASRQIFMASDGPVLSTPDLIRFLGGQARKPVRLWDCPLPLLWGGARLGDFFKLLTGKSVGLDSYAMERLTGSLAVDASEVFDRLGWKPPYTMQEGVERTFV